MTKNNPNLSDQQKKVLFEEATEAPGSSELNFEKREVVIIVQIVEQNYSTQIPSMKVAQDGLHFTSLFLMYLKLKLIIILDMLGQNITVKNVVDTMDIYLMMDHNQLVKDIVIMVSA